MKIVFSNHAKKRLIERGIKVEDVEKTIGLPDYMISKGRKKEAHKKINCKILKVVYCEMNNYINVITLI